MSDIVERLRDQADEVLDPGYPFFGTPELVREAADEIERLRERYDALVDELREIVAENERLRARLAEAARLLQDMRQHQGRIQPYVEQIDAFLAGEKP